jgi:uncharacterized SAM-binding protein YcdF (DUF218 family)
VVLGLIVLILLSSIIPLRVAIALHQTPIPQGILVLEGEARRIIYAAQFSHCHPPVDIWVSGCCSDSVLNKSIFQQEGIPAELVHYDLRATDTVTHFTTLVDYFVAQDIRHVYMVTSDYQMTRAKAIATLVFGSRGIAVTPVSVPSKNVPKETLSRILRDCLRSVFWIVTGHSGASLKSRSIACRICNAKEIQSPLRRSLKLLDRCT